MHLFNSASTSIVRQYACKCWHLTHDIWLQDWDSRGLSGVNILLYEDHSVNQNCIKDT